MRVFVYGMQASGASLTTYLLGQVPRSVVLVDLYSYEVMPAIEAPAADHVIAKAVVTMAHDFRDHTRNLRPDRSILLLRDPFLNYVGLSRKAYAHDDGALDDKFRRLNDVFRERDAFDLVLRYEDVVLQPQRAVDSLQGIGFPLAIEHYAFPRSRDEITAFNFEHCEWCRERFNRGWSFGNIHGDRMQQTLVHKVVPAAVRETVESLCPDVVRYYEQAEIASVNGVSRVASVIRDVAARPISDGAQRIVRAARRSVDSWLRARRAGDEA